MNQFKRKDCYRYLQKSIPKPSNNEVLLGADMVKSTQLHAAALCNVTKLLIVTILNFFYDFPKLYQVGKSVRSAI